MFAWNKARRRVGWQECQIRQRFESRIPSVCTRDKSPSLHQHQYFVSRYSIAGTQRHPGENQFTMNNDIIHWRPTHRSWNELEQIYFWPARVNDRSRLFNLKQFPGLKECSFSLYKWYTNVSFSFFFFIAIPFFFFFDRNYFFWIISAVDTKFNVFLWSSGSAKRVRWHHSGYSFQRGGRSLLDNSLGFWNRSPSFFISKLRSIGERIEFRGNREFDARQDLGFGKLAENWFIG